jgi:hypothetical protein
VKLVAADAAARVQLLAFKLALLVLVSFHRAQMTAFLRPVDPPSP